MTNRRNTQSNVLSLARWALPLVATTLVACGGGDEESPPAVIPGPSPVAVDAPPLTPANGTNARGTNVTGSLDFLVFDASGASAPATANTTRAASNVITFTASGPFAAASAGAPGGGLVISKDLSDAAVPTWNGILGNGGVLNLNWPVRSGGGLLSEGNFFVFCSAGVSYTLLTSTPSLEPASRAGAKVAVSGNFVPMTNVAPLYGKTFNRFDCTNSAPTTKFGDDKGTLTMTLNGVTLSQADTVAAFSVAGYRPVGGGTYKRRAYQITLAGTNPAVQYAIVALDTDASGTSTASVLYQYY